MKKRITGVILTIILLTAFVCPAFAASDSEAWVLAADAAYITHGDKTYWPMEVSYASQMNYNREWEHYDLDFVDATTRQVYGESYIDAVMGEEDVAVLLSLWNNNNYYGSELLYVEEAYQDTFLRVENGDPDVYAAYNDYDQSVSLNKSQYDAWSKGSALHMTARDMESYTWYYIYGCDSRQVIMSECGMVLRDLETEELYLLRYDEYERSYFYADGVFATDHDGTITIYRLEDETLRQQLITCYDTLPEDDLEWVMNYEENTVATGVIYTFFFGILPLAVMAFSLVMLIVVKQRSYRIPFIILLSGATTVLVSFVVIFMHLK